MKSFLIAAFLMILSLGYAQETYVYQFDNVSFTTAVPGAGERKVERLASLINEYISAIENDKYDEWYSLFSDSTIARVAPHKFPNKFRRLKEYNLDTDTLVITSVKQLPKPFENETGIEYEITIRVNSDLNIGNRVSFDHIKRGKDADDPRLFGINVVASDKGYKVCVHKYVSKGQGEGTGENGQ